jgi:uncharacterized protein YggE
MAEINGKLFVSAYGEELVEPDECKVRVTITSERETAAEAQHASTQTFDALLNALAAAKIKNEIETTYFNVERPRYFDSTKQKHVVQNFFRATHQLTVKVSAKEAAVSGVRFQLSKELEQSSRDKALEKAVKLAQKKATLLATSAGVNLGALQSLVDRAHSMNIAAPTDQEYEVHTSAMAIAAPATESGYQLNFAIQKISVYESVQLVYTTT